MTRMLTGIAAVTSLLATSAFAALVALGVMFPRAGGQYQLVTASEPYKMQGYQAVDELNRAFHKMPPSGFIQTPYLVTPENINAEGGDKDTFIPSNNYEQHYFDLWGVKK